MAVARSLGQGHVARSNPPQQIRLYRGVADQARKAAVDSVDIATFNVVVDPAVNGINYRCGEDADSGAWGMKIEPDGVERTPHVEPIGRSDDSLVAKTKHLAAGDKIDPALGRAAQLRVRLADVPDVL